MPKRRGKSKTSATTFAANPIKNDNLQESSLPVVSNFAEMDMKYPSAGIPAKIIIKCVVIVSSMVGIPLFLSHPNWYM